jgi:hypothetical protein
MTATNAIVTMDTVLVTSSEVLFQEIGGESVLLDLASEQYFGLDAVGTRIWSLVDGHASLTAIHHALCAEYDAPADRIRADVLALAQRLLEAGLVRAASA